jgi:hypothetical protein
LEIVRWRRLFRISGVYNFCKRLRRSACNNAGLLRTLDRKDEIFRARDWHGREVILDRRTYNGHICRYHTDAALAIDRIKDSFSSPVYVVECRQAKSENAIYQLQVGDHPWIVVAIKAVWLRKSKVKVSKVRMISTWYSIPQDQLQAELDKGRLLWSKAEKSTSTTTR